jgi:hypothetical protein
MSGSAVALCAFRGLDLEGVLAFVIVLAAVQSLVRSLA